MTITIVEYSYTLCFHNIYEQKIEIDKCDYEKRFLYQTEMH